MDQQALFGKSREPMPGLGRVIIPDDQDNNYPLSALIKDPVGDLSPLRTYRHYRSGPPLDQQATSHCVSFSWVQWLMSAPIVTKKNLPDTTWLYREAQRNDEWVGEEPDYYGTSIRAGAKIMQRLGHIDSYHWTQDANTAAHWLLNYGTIIFGTNWYSSMDAVDKGGVARINPGAYIRGGHAYLCVGYNQNMGMFRCINSWGVDYGENGRFWLLGEDVERLLREYGEGCAAVEKRVA